MAVVQTAYANGNSTRYLQETLKVFSVFFLRSLQFLNFKSKCYCDMIARKIKNQAKINYSFKPPVVTKFLSAKEMQENRA